MRTFICMLALILSWTGVTQAQSIEIKSSNLIETLQSRPNPPRFPDPGRDPRYPRDPGYPNPGYPRDPSYPPGYGRVTVRELCTGYFNAVINGTRSSMSLNTNSAGVLVGNLHIGNRSQLSLRGQCRMNGVDSAQISFTVTQPRGQNLYFTGRTYLWGHQIRMEGTYSEARRNYRWSASRLY